jgi:hypothetical protein
MKKNVLLQTFIYDFSKIQVTNYGSFEEMKKGTSAIHGATFFFYQKRHGAQKKGHGVMKKGHGAAPFYFSLDKTLPFESRQRNDTKYQPQCSTVELYIFCLNLFSKRLITSIFLLKFFLFK